MVGLHLTSSVHNDTILINTRQGLYARAISGGAWMQQAFPSADVRGLAAHPDGSIYAISNYFGDYWLLGSDHQWSRLEHFDSLANVHSAPYTVGAITVDSAGTLIAIVNSTFFRSTDKGSHWYRNTINFGGKPIVAVTKEGVIFTATNAEGLFRSTDAGHTWDQFNEGIFIPQLFSVAVSANGTVFSGGTKKFYRSTDAGKVWEEPEFPFISSSDAVNAITCYGTSSVIVGVNRTGTYFSSNNGSWWENHSEGLARDTIHAILATPDGPIFVATTSGVYEYSSSAQTWKNVNDGIIQGAILSLTLGADGKVYAGTDGDGVYRTTKRYGTASVVEANEYRSSDLRIYPNPATSELIIHHLQDRERSYRIVVYDLLGNVRLAVAEFQNVLDIKALTAGQYFLYIFTDTDRTILPFSVAR